MPRRIKALGVARARQVSEVPSAISSGLVELQFLLPARIILLCVLQLSVVTDYVS